MIEEKETAAPLLLIESFADELLRGAKLIGKIENKIYRRTANGTGSIGGHFRHNLDFANSFLNGIAARKIDYNRRERDARIEENRGYAIKKIALAACRLRSLPPQFLSRKVLIRSEISAEVWHESSALRELEFLHSHTVHHHALIAEKLAFFGVEASENFGVAPSTLRFWERQNAAPSI